MSYAAFETFAAKCNAGEVAVAACQQSYRMLLKAYPDRCPCPPRLAVWLARRASAYACCSFACCSCQHPTRVVLMSTPYTHVHKQAQARYWYVHNGQVLVDSLCMSYIHVHKQAPALALEVRWRCP